MKRGTADMRMNKDDELTAHTIVNEFDKDELTEIIKKYGEERWAARISEFIVKERNKEPIVSTYQLVDIIKAAIPASARREGPHPAKRTFQALRIYINDELGQLSRSIDHYIDVLNSRGRLSIITFHSLEDRIVKEAFNSRLDPCTCPKELPVCICNIKTDVKKVFSKTIKPSDQELKENPRARSAKLRFIEKR